MVPGAERYKINYSLKRATNVETELYKIVKASFSLCLCQEHVSWNTAVAIAGNLAFYDISDSPAVRLTQFPQSGLVCRLNLCGSCRAVGLLGRSTGYITAFITQVS